MITSSTSRGSSCDTLRRAWIMQWAARSSGRVMLKEPRNDLASPVRELATTTASRMVLECLPVYLMLAAYLTVGSLLYGPQFAAHSYTQAHNATLSAFRDSA